MSVSYQVTDIMRNTENCQGQCKGYIIEFIFRMNHRDVVFCGGSRHGAVIAIGLCSSSHVRGDVVIFHHCDCSQKLIALEATLKARSWLSELNANECFYKELFSLVVLSWSLYYWVMGFYYEGACHIGDCV